MQDKVVRKKEFSDKIDSALREFGLSMTSFSKIMGVSRTMLYDIKKGKVPLSEKMSEKLSQTLEELAELNVDKKELNVDPKNSLTGKNDLIDLNSDILAPLVRKFHPGRAKMICDWIQKNNLEEPVFLFDLFDSLSKYIHNYGNFEPDVVFTPKKSESESYSKMIKEVSDIVLAKAKMAIVEKRKNQSTNPEAENV